MVDEAKGTEATKETPAQEAAPEAPKTIEERMAAAEDVLRELLNQFEVVFSDIEALKKNAPKSKGLFGGKRERTPMKDLKTGVVHVSKAAVGKAFAAEIGEDPLNTMVYYKVDKALRMEDGSARFVPASEEEGKAAVEEMQAKIAQEVEESNKKLAAEAAASEAAAPAAPAPKPATPPAKPVPPKPPVKK